MVGSCGDDDIITQLTTVTICNMYTILDKMVGSCRDDDIKTQHTSVTICILL